MIDGKLQRNERGRWGLNGSELTSGVLIEIEIDGHWLPGVIEHWSDGYYWFSQRDGIPVVLHSGINARIPQERRAAKT